MNKYNIQFLGQKQYIARDLDEARKLAMSDLKYVHQSLGLSINGHMDLGPVGEVDLDLANDEQQLEELEEEVARVDEIQADLKEQLYKSEEE